MLRVTESQHRRSALHTTWLHLLSSIAELQSYFKERPQRDIYYLKFDESSGRFIKLVCQKMEPSHNGHEAPAPLNVISSIHVVIKGEEKCAFQSK